MLHCHGPHHDSTYLAQKAIELVKEAGLKMTNPRQRAIHVLAESGQPVTVEEIHHILNASDSDRPVDLVTVYRIMAKLEEISAVARCGFSDGAVRYELVSSEHHHHHIVCRVCKKSKPVAVCDMDSDRILPPGHGYQNITHRLEFFGICPSCSS